MHIALVHSTRWPAVERPRTDRKKQTQPCTSSNNPTTQVQHLQRKCNTRQTSDRFVHPCKILIYSKFLSCFSASVTLQNAFSDKRLLMMLIRLLRQTSVRFHGNRFHVDLADDFGEHHRLVGWQSRTEKCQLHGVALGGLVTEKTGSLQVERMSIRSTHGNGFLVRHHLTKKSEALIVDEAERFVKFG